MVELLQEAGERMLELVADLFTDILKGRVAVAGYWKETRLKVLFKKGDAEMPENYRPISLLSILYKLFSKVVCGRVRETLMTEQSADQAGFRSGFR